MIHTERRLVTIPGGNPDLKTVIPTFGEKIKRDVRIKPKLEDLLEAQQSNSRLITLFNGLKLNTEHNSAIAEPLLFLARRLIYAAAIVYL